MIRSRFLSKLLLIVLLFFFSNFLIAANGDEFGTTFQGGYGFKLLDAQSATSSGVWVSISNVRSASYCFSGLEAGGSITLQVLNDVSIPANDTDGFTIATISPAGNACATLSGFPARWIKAEKSAGGTPTASTVLFWGLSR